MKEAKTLRSWPKLFGCLLPEPKRIAKGSERPDQLNLLLRLAEGRKLPPFDFFGLDAWKLLSPRTRSDFVEKFNRACSLLPRKIMLGIVPIGTEGWEANQSERLMRRLFGEDAATYRRISRADWFAFIEKVKAPILAFVVAHIKVWGMKWQQLFDYARHFLRFCRRTKKRPFLWLSAMMFLKRKDEELAHALVSEVGSEVERIGWMDVPPIVVKGWFTLDQLLEKITAATPSEKAIMQYNHFVPLTSTPKKVMEYMRQCREHGVDAFAVLAPLEHFFRSPWKDFYRRPRKGRSEG